MSTDLQQPSEETGEIEASAEPPSANVLARRVKKILLRVLDRVIVYDPMPLEKPAVDAHLLEMPLTERVLETLRFNAASFEYAIGSDGWLRGWFLTGVRVLFLFVVPFAVVLAILAMLVPIFGSIASITASIEASARSLFWAVIFLLALFVLLPWGLSIVLMSWKAGSAQIRKQVAAQEKPKTKVVKSRPIGE